MSDFSGVGDDPRVSQPIRVMIVDDHEVMAASLARVLDDEPDLVCVGLASSLAQARARVPAAAPDAAGFLSKTRSLAEVTSAVRAAAQGEASISSEMLARLLPRLTRVSAPVPTLTRREDEVLARLAQGMSNAAIASELTVSVNTVRNHVSNLSAKLGAHSKLEAMSIAIQRGLLSPPQ